MEQKNGAVVRRIGGLPASEGLEAAAALAELYRSLRLFVNFFQPSFKLAEQVARRRQGYEALSSAAHTLPTATRFICVRRVGEREAACTIRDSRSGRSSEID